jgi:tRNA threonylcarbamoyladenosine biosynthesis protein TsaE
VNEAMLRAWGERVGREAARPLVLAISGERGAGKSVLARAVARGAGVASPMPSPTFNLVFRYETARGAVLHLDLYRLNRPEEVWELGWSELGVDQDVALIEWPERAQALLPADRWDVRLASVAGDPLLRELSAVRHGDAPMLPVPDATA